MSAQLPRPSPPNDSSRRVSEMWERLVDWVRWTGPRRVIAGAVTALAVVAVGWWMFRPAAPAVESVLPMTDGAGATGAVEGSAAQSDRDPVQPSSSGVSSSGVSSSGVSSNEFVIVHVTGQVVAPGVVKLASGSRVVDAVAAAGGASPAAALDSLNLAAVLDDGQQVHVPAFGESLPPVSSASVSEGTDFPIDLNAADAEALDSLPGVGPATAAAIVRWRDENGAFVTIDDLLDVPGLGPAKVEALRGLVVVD